MLTACGLLKSSTHSIVVIQNQLWSCMIHNYLCLSMSVGPSIFGYSHCKIGTAGVYSKFSGRLSKEPFPWLIQKFPCILIFKTGQTGCQLDLSKGQIRLDLMSGRPLVKNPETWKSETNIMNMVKGWGHIVAQLPTDLHFYHPFWRYRYFITFTHIHKHTQHCQSCLL